MGLTVLVLETNPSNANSSFQFQNLGRIGHRKDMILVHYFSALASFSTLWYRVVWRKPICASGRVSYSYPQTSEP